MPMALKWIIMAMEASYGQVIPKWSPSISQTRIWKHAFWEGQLWQSIIRKSCICFICSFRQWAKSGCRCCMNVYFNYYQYIDTFGRQHFPLKSRDMSRDLGGHHSNFVWFETTYSKSSLAKRLSICRWKGKHSQWPISYLPGEFWEPK